jgi:hypothetical protein
MKNTIRTAREYQICFQVGLELTEVGGKLEWIGTKNQFNEARNLLA